PAAGDEVRNLRHERVESGQFRISDCGLRIGIRHWSFVIGHWSFVIGRWRLNGAHDQAGILTNSATCTVGRRGFAIPTSPAATLVLNLACTAGLVETSVRLDRASR